MNAVTQVPSLDAFETLERRVVELERQLAEAPATAHGLLTKADVAERLGVHPRTVERLVERGELAAVDVTADCVRIDARELEAFIERRRRPTRRTRPAATAPRRRPKSGRSPSFADRLRSSR